MTFIKLKAYSSLNKIANKIFRFENILLISLCFVSVFYVCDSSIDPYFSSKWNGTLFVLITSAICLLIKCLIKGEITFDFELYKNVILFICVLQSVYILIQYCADNNNFYNANSIGSFNNHAGVSACLCLSLPFVLNKLLISVSPKKKILYVSCILSILGALLISKSRIGLVVFIVLLFIFICSKYKLNSVFKICSLIIFVVFVIIIYNYRVESVNGRFLIWLVSFEQFKDAPLWGHGYDSFRRLYMNYQANYFHCNPNSNFIMVADSVQMPFNEYIRVLLNWGVFGLASVLSVTFIFLKKFASQVKEISLVFIVIGILSLTSYPFSYPFTWIVLLFSIFLVKGEKYCLCLNNTTKFLIFPITIILLIFGNEVFLDIKAERKWHQADKNNNILEYHEIYNRLSNNPYFLYNFATKLYLDGNIKRSKIIALSCKNFFTDYDLELLLGDIYLKENKFEDALKQYYLCCEMCPNRFIPLYQIFYIYNKLGNNKNATNIAKQILCKPVKISNYKIYEIRHRVRKYLNNIEKQNNLIY